MTSTTGPASKHERIEALISKVRDGSPQELISHAERTGGFGVTLDLVFDQLPTVFKAERTRKDEGTFVFEIATPADETLRYQVLIDHGECRVSHGAADAPTTTFNIGFTDFLELAVGSLSGGDAYMTGRLQVAGDIVFAMKWQGWFSAL